MAQETGLSTLSLGILGLIRRKPLTGYDLRKVFATTPMGHFSSSPGAIYPALKRIVRRPGSRPGGTGQDPPRAGRLMDFDKQLRQ